MLKKISLRFQERDFFSVMLYYIPDNEDWQDAQCVLP